MENKEVLVQTRELIGDPARWIAGSDAIDSRGYACQPTSPNARQWCVLGAVEKVTKGEQTATIDSPTVNFLNDCAGELYRLRRAPFRMAHHINDWDGHEAILSLLDYAIERCEDGDN